MQEGNGQGEYKPLFNEIGLREKVLGREFKVKSVCASPVHSIKLAAPLIDSKLPLSVY